MITGVIAPGLPFACKSGTFQVLAAALLDSGTRSYVGQGVASNSNAPLIHTESSNVGSVGATAPFTWTTGDRVIMTGTYESNA